MSYFNFGIRLKAYTKEFGQKIKQAGSNAKDSFGEMSSRAKQARKAIKDEFKDADKDLNPLSRGLDFVKGKMLAIVSVGAAFVGFGGAIQASREFEAQLSRVGAITSATAGEMEQLKTAAEEAGSSTKYNSTQAAEGLEILARAGYGASESIALLPTLLNVATAEGLELSQAAQLVTDTLSIMGLAIENGAEAADVLAKGASLSNTTMEQLGNAISYAGQYAKTSGFSLEKLVATLDVLAKNGLRGERAGTGLRSILSQLQDPASKAAKAVSDLGIDITDFDAVISGLKGAGDGASEAINAFGVEAGPALRSLLDEGVDGLKRYQEELENAAGTAKKMADDVSNNLDGAIISFDSLIDTLKKKLADPILEPLARDLRDFTASIKQMMPAVESAGSSISFFYDRLSGLVKFFGNSFSVALTSVTAVGLQIPIILAEIELSIDKLLNKAGLVDDATVKRLETEVGALKAARAALVESAVEDANDAAAAINQLFGFIDNAKNKTNSVTQEAADGVKKVGEAAADAANQVGAAKDDVLGSFQVIAGAADSTGEQIRDAFVKGINVASTTQEVEALKEEFWGLWRQGKITAKDLASGMRQVEGVLQGVAAQAANAKSAVNGISVSNSGMSSYVEKLDEAAELQKEKTEATEADTAATKTNTAEVEKNGGAASASAERAGTMASYTYKLAGLARDQWVAMGQSMSDAFDGFVQRTQDYQKQITQSGNRTAGAFIALMSNAYARAAYEAEHLKKRYDAQNVSAARFIERLSDTTTATAEMADKADQALSRFDLLGDEQLSALRSAIAAVRAETDSLNDSLSSTLNTLRDELDSLNNDTLSIETRAYKNQLADLNEQLDRAQELGSKEAIKSAREAISLLKETYKIKKQTIVEESAANDTSANTTAANTSTGTTSRTVNIQIGGKTQSVNVADGASEAVLINALEDIQAASL